MNQAKLNVESIDLERGWLELNRAADVIERQGAGALLVALTFWMKEPPCPCGQASECFLNGEPVCDTCAEKALM